MTTTVTAEGLNAVLDGSPIVPAPSAPGEWSLKQIESALSRSLDGKGILEVKVQDGQQIVFIPWFSAAAILNKYAPGWEWRIKDLTFSLDRVFLVGQLSVPTSNGVIVREATGTELLKREKENRQTREIELKEIAYGDPTSNAEAMAFCRCAAKFGLGLYLYKQRRDERRNQQSFRR